MLIRARSSDKSFIGPDACILKGDHDRATQRRTRRPPARSRGRRRPQRALWKRLTVEPDRLCDSVVDRLWRFAQPSPDGVRSVRGASSEAGLRAAPPPSPAPCSARRTVPASRRSVRSGSEAAMSPGVGMRAQSEPLIAEVEASAYERERPRRPGSGSAPARGGRCRCAR